MDLTHALELARRGRPQAPADLNGAADAPLQARRRDRSDRMDGALEREARRAAAADVVPGMSQAEVYALTERVAERLAREFLPGRHWYDLGEEQRERFRAFARISIRAVNGANARRHLNRIRAERQGPMEPMSGAEIDERERLADISIRGDQTAESRRAEASG